MAWIIEETQLSEGYCTAIYDEATGLRIADQVEPEHAHTIAEAPRMKEALEDARAAIASLDDFALGEVSDEENGTAWPIKLELLAKIDAALARANGEEG